MTFFILKNVSAKDSQTPLNGILSKLAHGQHHTGPWCTSSNFPILFKMAARRWNLWLLGVDLENVSVKVSQTPVNGILSKLAHGQHNIGPWCMSSNFPIRFKMAAWQWNFWLFWIDLVKVWMKVSQTLLNWILSKLVCGQHHMGPWCTSSNFPIGFTRAAWRWNLWLFLFWRMCQRRFLRHCFMEFYQSWHISSTIWVPDARRVIFWSDSKWPFGGENYDFFESGDLSGTV